MKRPVICPNCNSSFSVSRANAGKRAKCPKCEQPFVITFGEAESSPDVFPVIDSAPPPVPVAPAQTQSAQPRIKATPDDSSRRSSRKTVAIPQWAISTLFAIATLILGYFLGREHVRYQMRSALSDVASAFSDGLKRAASSETPDEPIPQLMIGKSHSSDGFAITLASATIATPKAKDIMGNLREGKNAALILTFTFANTDERRVLGFRKANQFSAGHFRLRDDVDNVIRGIDYGFGSQPVGALTRDEDVAPGQSASHIELFSIPPPKTQFLILTVDLACLGSHGLIEFKIPAATIAK